MLRDYGTLKRQGATIQPAGRGRPKGLQLSSETPTYWSARAVPISVRRLMSFQRRASPIEPSQGRSLATGARASAVELSVELFTVPSQSVRWILVAFCVVSSLGMLWDQPGFYGWENDGAAPRDFFGGIADNLTPGHAHRYPLFHYLLIGLVNLPVLLVDLMVATWTGLGVGRVVLSVPSMTAIAVLTKLLHLGMACVGLLAAERIWRTCFGARAAIWALLFTVTNLTVAYYARVTNVDIAYLMWVILAMERILLIAATGASRHYRWFAVFVAAGLATKDQAYASFVFVAPLYLLWLPGTSRAVVLSPAGSAGPRVRANWRHFSELAKATGWTVAAYLVLSGAVFNPTGFVRRVGELAGTNSQDWRQYPPGLHGMLANTLDLIALQEQFFWPTVVVIVGWLGVLTAPWLRAKTPSTSVLHWSWSWFPIAAGLSNTLAFTLVVGRAEHRFMLVLGYWLSGYVGVIVCAALARSRSIVARRIVRLVGWLLLGLGLKQNLELLYTQWTDPRKRVEGFLLSLPPETRVETYGLGVYLPRFAFEEYDTTRVSSPTWGKPPQIVGMREVQDDFRNITDRNPDVLVLPEGFANRFRAGMVHGAGTRAMDKYRDAPGAQEFFSAILSDRLNGYSRMDVGSLVLPDWYAALGGRLLQVHGSTGMPVWVFVRTGMVATSERRRPEQGGTESGQ